MGNESYLPSILLNIFSLLFSPRFLPDVVRPPSASQVKREQLFYLFLLIASPALYVWPIALWRVTFPPPRFGSPFYPNQQPTHTHPCVFYVLRKRFVMMCLAVWDTGAGTQRTPQYVPTFLRRPLRLISIIPIAGPTDLPASLLVPPPPVLARATAPPVKGHRYLPAGP